LLDSRPLSPLSYWGTIKPGVTDLFDLDLAWEQLSFDGPVSASPNGDLYVEDYKISFKTPALPPGEYAFGVSPTNSAPWSNLTGLERNNLPSKYTITVMPSATKCDAQITYGKNVSGRLTDKERDIISGLLCKSGDYTGLVSSYNRTSAEQARVMLEGYFFAKKRNPSQTVNGGLKALRSLYSSESGLYAIKQLDNALMGENSSYITLNQAANIKSKLVSSLARGVDDAITNYPGSFKHVNFANGAPRTDQTVRAVDIAPSSIEGKSSKESFMAAAFALKSAGVINEFFFDPSKENAYHIEFFLS
jgi:hypothetical protein